MDLGILEKVDLRTAWKHEARNFTQWLARQENLDLLSQEMGVDIKLVQAEAPIGSFSLDILAEEGNTGRKIIIENQLEPTDHIHLGQVITYASGVDAKIIVWIVSEAREEHQKAIDWLNEHTDDETNFFLVKMELWKIGNSPPAPKFHILEQPNDWAKVAKSSASTGELTETKIMQFNFWTQFKENLHKTGSKLVPHKASPQHWLNISMGTSHAHITLTINTREEYLGCEVYIDSKKDPKHIFSELFKIKEEIEREMGQSLEWMELSDRHASRILAKYPVNTEDEAKWVDYFTWMNKMAEKFQNTFSKRITKIVQEME